MSAALLECRSLSIEVPERTLCRDISFRIEPGQCWALLGRNGSGKTSLLHTLAGLRAPAAGAIEVQGRSIIDMARREIAQIIGLLPQDNHDAFPCTVLETALIGRHPHLSGWAAESDADVNCARAALRAVGLAELEVRRIDTLSGGERRRLAIATVLTQQPRLFLLDEPSNHLDLQHQISLLGHIRELTRQYNRAVLMSLHDVNLALRFCDHVMLLFPDGTASGGPIDQCLDRERLEILFGQPFQALESATGTVFLPA